MPWVRLDDSMPDHPKIVTVGALAELIQYRALCYASRHLTDGFIPEAAMPRFMGGLENVFDERPEVLADRLVLVGLWRKVRGGWEIHDYLEYNPSREETLEARSRNALRQKTFRERNSVTNSVMSNGVTNGPVTLPPSPSPSPSPKTKKLTTLSGWRPTACRLLDFLNKKTGRHYQPAEANLKLITARLKAGATEDQCRAVIGRKCAQWLGDAKMAEFLRPATLFNATNFAQYQGELPATAFSPEDNGHAQ